MLPEQLTALLPLIDTVSPVSGGDIHRAFRVVLASGKIIFAKTHDDPPSAIFECEADGLGLLNRAAPGLCPEVLAVCDQGLALEWLELKPGRRGAVLGRALATLHRVQAPSFGGQPDNYLATIKQAQPECSSWAELYTEHRLAPLLHNLPRSLARALESLLPKLASLLDLPDPPSWLHGDFWSGNAGETTGGRACIFDPAVSTGHREQDLAMTLLFGGFNADFYRAYEEVYPLTHGWRDRVSLHQIYPLLVHVVLFGDAYHHQALDAVERWL